MICIQNDNGHIWDRKVSQYITHIAYCKSCATRISTITQWRTLNSAIVIPRLNLRFTSKELTVLVTRTDTVGFVMTVTLPSIFCCCCFSQAENQMTYLALTQQNTDIRRDSFIHDFRWMFNICYIADCYG